MLQHLGIHLVNFFIQASNIKIQRTRIHVIYSLAKMLHAADFERWSEALQYPLKAVTLTLS
jgi:hypothetical protein